MKIINPSYEIITPIDGKFIVKHIEKAARTCYKSEGKITENSYEQFLSGVIKSGHESVLEHFSFSIRFIIDRGVLAELTRHRLASFSAESTRYCTYSKDQFGNEITVISPCFWEKDSVQYKLWECACSMAENSYILLIKNGAKAEEARDILPLSTKTEIVVTANIREWRHILRLRTSQRAHPQIREVMCPLLDDLKSKIPVLFNDISYI